MTTPAWTLLLNSGGLRSLVAAALAPRERLAMLYIHDGSPASRMHHAAFLKQADHFKAEKKIDLMMPHVGLIPSSLADPTVVPHRVPLAQYQMLIAAVGQALHLKARAVIWPVQVASDFHAAARLIETLQLTSKIIALEEGREVSIETPLLDMTDRQLIEVGHQMDLPWALSRSCDVAENLPCGDCHGCRRRAAAFAAAALDDPLQLTTTDH